MADREPSLIRIAARGVAREAGTCLVAARDEAQRMLSEDMHPCMFDRPPCSTFA